MAYRLPNLIWLRAFEAAARLGSFTAAAGELGLTQAAVSHQIRSLEGTLGFSLFIRRARTLELTEMGRAYVPSVRKAIEDLAYSTQGLFGPRVRRLVTLRVPISTAVLWLAPRLKAFRSCHPDVSIRLLSAIWADAIADEEIDIDIRVGSGAWPGHQARLLSEETVMAIAAPETSAEISSAADLSTRELVHILGFQDQWGRYFKSADLAYDPRSPGITVDTSLAAVEIVTAGGGVALVMKRFALDLAASGRVSLPLDREIPLGQAHYLVSPAEQRPLTAEANILLDWIVEAFADGSAH